MNGYEDVRKALNTLITGGAAGAGTLLVAGPPRCGKTEFAYEALLRGLEAFGGTGAVMAVSNRVTADVLGDRAIRAIGASAQVRPVTTLSALAFRVLAAARFAAARPAPRLLNGAEQDALLRQVLAVHLAHARAGELCETCRLLRSYFASDDWASSVGETGEATAGASKNASDGVRERGDSGEQAASTVTATTAVMLERGVSSAFVDQLRDMLARMDELGAGSEQEESLLHAAYARDADGGRLGVQWRLAFALRREYHGAVGHMYPGEYRLDASRLLVEGAAVLEESDAAASGALPSLLVVDDFQDATLAGMRFLEALHGMGVRLLLVGNPDESVQTFRGSYPEYLFMRARLGDLRARLVTISEATGDGGDVRRDYRAIVAARVSLSIPSPQDDLTPLPDRPGKTARLQGAWPISRLPVGSPEPMDGSLRAALYRSPREELDDVVWRIKRMRLDGRATWNDMAVIAHDNGTVRAFGERLRRDGVPVRYSSVTRPLKDEPFVQGLFALIELARLRRQGLDGTDMTLAQIGAFTRSRVSTIMAGPLITAGAKPGEGRPARIEPIESAMSALESLAGVAGVPEQQESGEYGIEGSSSEETLSGAMLPELVGAWKKLKRSADERDARTRLESGITVDDTLVDGAAHTADNLPFCIGAQYAMLALDDAQAPAASMIGALARVVGGDPQIKAFQRVWRIVARIADGLGGLESHEPQFVLALAWDTTGVAKAWQRTALANTPQGRAANDRLDVAMRLFQYAEGGTAGHDIVSFIAQVRAMQIEADSLAHLGPVEQAVTLTTPAGAAGRHWRHVWLPAVQQDVWPNLAERNTLFAGEDLADIILYGDASDASGGQSGLPDVHREGLRARTGTHDPRLVSVLSSEKKSLLVALTRADCDVTVSAVRNDDLTPSDFLYGYLPEWFSRDTDDATGFTLVGEDGETSAQSGSFAGLEADPRGLVAAARVMLARHPVGSPQAKDAAATLALLAEHGIDSANPDNWAYLRSCAGAGTSAGTGDSDVAGAPGVSDVAATADATGAERAEAVASRGGAPVVVLSPSAADSLWGCPVCWMLENRFAGPRQGSAATGFGRIIHAVAEQGSREGLDLPGFMAGTSTEERIAAIAARLKAIYDDLKPDPAAIADPIVRYDTIRKDEGAATALANIASYFVNSNMPDYLESNAKYFAVGTLVEASCEETLAAMFDLTDILAAYNALPGIDPIGVHELGVLMGVLVGGWPDGMSDDLVIRLSGRIDRKETRVMADGGERIRLIDYKTGHVPTAMPIVNDLQLVCYQLGLTFPEHAESGRRLRGAQALAVAPVIAQSALFHVGYKTSPAQSSGSEGLHQPALFTAGSLNTEPYTRRNRWPKPEKLLDIPVISPDSRPEGIEGVEGIDDTTWRQFASLNGTQALWALTMIARVFYAGAASRSNVIRAHPTAQHLGQCHERAVCPACAGQIDTVFETRQA